MLPSKTTSCSEIYCGKQRATPNSDPQVLFVRYERPYIQTHKGEQIPQYIPRIKKIFKGVEQIF